MSRPICITGACSAEDRSVRKVEVVPEFALENGAVLREVSVAYHTWGTLNAARDNAVVVCHALTGSADVSDWWSGLLGPGRAFDPGQDFVVGLCALASPYGTASPLTDDPVTGEPYGADFPKVTIRDTVRLHRRVLERLGVRQVALAAGGSMGGMHVLEWAFEEKADGTPFVQALAPVAVGRRHAPWQIGWNEAQRQAIYADARWRGGHYTPGEGPRQGLAAARMVAMVSYRSYPSYAERFGRERMAPTQATPEPAGAATSQQQNGRSGGDKPENEVFAVESYLRYQGQKLTGRFDANCYVRLTQQMDSHDVARGRSGGPDDSYADVLGRIRQPALVVGIDSDVLYPLAEQRQLAAHLPNATLDVLASPHGHDAFLIETDALNARLRDWRHGA
ncbi:MAG: homoserine O-acetyltransferase [Bacteroidetes bacterium QS_9_68_14]|nr:MAG: homoserine O-acetyltransferase [Bacteroidetes bacterium QS_9_68_14]